MEVNGQLHDPTALPRGKSCRHALNRGLGGSQSSLESLEKRTENNDTHK